MNLIEREWGRKTFPASVMLSRILPLEKGNSRFGREEEKEDREIRGRRKKGCGRFREGIPKGRGVAGEGKKGGDRTGKHSLS